MTTARHLLIIGGLLLAGCATTQGLPADQRSRTYYDAYEDVFRAAVQVLTDNGYAVTNADPDVGIINTDYKANSGISAALMGRTRQKVTLMLDGSDEGTRVMATIALESGNAFGSYNAQNIGRDDAISLYNQLFNAIASHLRN